MAEEFGGWLDELASAAPTPGGGGAAAVSAAMGASLICMVCNLTIGKPKYAAAEEQMTAALARATQVRQVALTLADEDARVFELVMSAYRLPRATDEEKAARSAAIQEALAGAADVPLRLAGLAAEVIGLAADIVDGANPSVISDVAVAAATARAALDSSLVNVEINIASMTDEPARQALAEAADSYAAGLHRADEVIRTVRRKIAG